MTLALRRTVFADGEQRADDYEIRHNGQTVGRVYRMRSETAIIALRPRAGRRP
jgi:hypothetical protein